jgi:hypothetical protein
VQVFQALREKLRCKEIWVAGRRSGATPTSTCNPDFEANRAENYARLRKPLDPRRFTCLMREELDAELSALNAAVGQKCLAWLKIADRRGAGASTSCRWPPRPNPGTCAG